MSTSLSWALLVVAGGLEIAFALGLKSASGFQRPWVMAGTVGALLGSLALLSAALKALPVGAAYAVWTGIGAAGTAILGMVLLGEPASVVRLACIGLIVCGVIGLRLAG
jgi:quaternary ammonium compound-resistance protein SugE